MLATDGTHVACSTDESLYMWQARDVASLVRDTAWRVRAEERYDEEECVRARVRGMVRAQKRKGQRKRVSKRRRRDRARSSRTQRKRRRLAGRASRLLRSRDSDSSEQDLAKPRRGTPQERRARRRARKRASARVRRDDGSANSRGNGATSAARSSTGAVTNDCNMLEAATDMEYCEERDDDSLTEESTDGSPTRDAERTPISQHVSTPMAANPAARGERDDGSVVVLSDDDDEAWGLCVDDPTAMAAWASRPGGTVMPGDSIYNRGVRDPAAAGAPPSDPAVVLEPAGVSVPDQPVNAAAAARDRESAERGKEAAAAAGAGSSAAELLHAARQQSTQGATARRGAACATFGWHVHNDRKRARSASSGGNNNKYCRTDGDSGGTEELTAGVRATGERHPEAGIGVVPIAATTDSTPSRAMRVAPRARWASQYECNIILPPGRMTLRQVGALHERANEATLAARKRKYDSCNAPRPKNTKSGHKRERLKRRRMQKAQSECTPSPEPPGAADAATADAATTAARKNTAADTAVADAATGAARDSMKAGAAAADAAVEAARSSVTAGTTADDDGSSTRQRDS